MIIADTSGLLAAFGVAARRYPQARSAYEADAGPVIMSPFVLAELDQLLLSRAGIKAELDLLQEVADGVFELASFSASDTRQAAAVAENYADLCIGIADASIVVLAARYRTAPPPNYRSRAASSRWSRPSPRSSPSPCSLRVPSGTAAST